MTAKSTQVQVSLGDRSYPIFIGSDEIRNADIASYVSGKKALIVTNETIAPLYLELLERQLIDKQVSRVILADGEQYKNLDTLNLIFDRLIGDHHDRKTTLIALGGGVVGDMTGFAAACYQRGVPFIQIPTTLLAQVDSSVGGKTAVNHAMGKNMIGAFYQPQAVIIDTDTLSTLPDREFQAGLAEVIKYGLIIDADFFQWLENNIDLLLQRDKQTLAYAIELSCVSKARIVAEDETEQGIRAILNLGHTFGHAIETFQNYKQWIHGEAVAAGMVMAAELSVISGDLPEADLQRTKALLQRCSLPVAPPADMTAEDFTQLMLRDKKVLDGQLRLVLLKRLGEASVTDQFSIDHLNQVLTSACAAS
jgi:3-dehydroquinate synthase